MTDDVIIQVEGLGKMYRIRTGGQRSERYTALRDVIAEKAKSFFRLPSGKRKVQSGGNGSPLPLSSSPSARASTEEFWALRNVNFEVKRGEVVGIIGRNGAGKSTLLKILSRITEPTEGRIRIRGRVASLLEVGTGFHPELTGRENIFLNGAILGMGRVEIKSKFDEIVDFAEIEKFLDTPVKRYSSGMYVRLAFAVAAHLEPEILVVDEVLAVGDAEFQKKCLGKMQEVSRGGRTVLFVSHNMAAINSLCSKGLLLLRGNLAFSGGASEAVAVYLNSAQQVSLDRKFLSEVLTLERFECAPSTLPQFSSLHVSAEISCTTNEVISDLTLEIHGANGQLIALIDLRSAQGPYRVAAGDVLTITADIKELPLVEGDFDLSVYINAGSVCAIFRNLFPFSIVPSIRNGKITPREPRFRGVVELESQMEYRINPAQKPTALQH